MKQEGGLGQEEPGAAAATAPEAPGAGQLSSLRAPSFFFHLDNGAFP